MPAPRRIEPRLTLTVAQGNAVQSAACWARSFLRGMRAGGDPVARA